MPHWSPRCLTTTAARTRKLKPEWSRWSRFCLHLIKFERKAPHNSWFTVMWLIRVPDLLFLPLPVAESPQIVENRYLVFSKGAVGRVWSVAFAASRSSATVVCSSALVCHRGATTVPCSANDPRGAEQSARVSELRAVRPQPAKRKDTTTNCRRHQQQGKDTPNGMGVPCQYHLNQRSRGHKHSEGHSSFSSLSHFTHESNSEELGHTQGIKG